MLRDLENFENLTNVGHNTMNVQGISLNEWELYFSKLLIYRIFKWNYR